MGPYETVFEMCGTRDIQFRGEYQNLKYGVRGYPFSLIVSCSPQPVHVMTREKQSAKGPETRGSDSIKPDENTFDLQLEFNTNT